MLQTLSYRRHDFDNAVLSLPSRTTGHFNIIRHRPSLGKLDILPPELLPEILLLLGLHTLTSFRLINTHTLSIVDALHEYKHLIIHAPGALHALFITGVASHFTATHLFKTLCTPACTICGKFGGFLFIPDCIRCCMTCLRSAPALMPLTKTDGKAVFGLTEKQLTALVPIVSTVPGSYTLDEKEVRRKRYLVSRSKMDEAVITAGRAQGTQTKAKVAYGKRLAARNAKLESFDYHGNLNITIDHIHRFMSATPFPYFDCNVRTLHVGVSCRGCQIGLERASHSGQTTSTQAAEWFERRDEMYTEYGFLEHVKGCRDAQELWQSYHD